VVGHGGQVAVVAAIGDRGCQTFRVSVLGECNSYSGGVKV
jgi:hypothetical protein